MLAVINLPWTLPITVNLLFWRIPIHPILDMTAYFLGFRLYLFLRKRSDHQPVGEDALWLGVGCLLGALIGSKVLAWLESPRISWILICQNHCWSGGKTIVGGLLGGWVGTEWVKRARGIKQATGNAYVYPLILGMCIGRIGCFLSGLIDQTHGIETHLPWGVNFGDGIPRHPTQIYEIFFLLTLWLVLSIKRTELEPHGLKFKWFMVGYLSFRFLVDFIKPHSYLYDGLGAIQWACLLGLVGCAFSLMKIMIQTEIQESHG